MRQGREVRELARELEEKCSIMRDTLRSRKAASDEELAAYWPKGEENKSSDVRAWIFCNANYTRFCDRLTSAKTDRARNTEADVVAALRDTPERVTTASGEELLVYPKSFDALDFIAQRDRRIQWLVEQREKVAARAIALEPGLLDTIGREISFQHGLIMWSATHTGPGLPFSDREAPIALPESIDALGPSDYLAIYQAFMRVNAVRLYTLQLLLDARLSADQKNKSKAPSWLTFFASRAEEAHTTADVMMRDRSLGSQIAQALLAAETRLPDPAQKVA